MAALLIFNPEHDFALAVGNGPYTPPASVVKIKNNLALLSALWAEGSDFILIPDETPDSLIPSLEHYDIFVRKKLKTVRFPELADSDPHIDRIIPWGWNHNLRRTLLENGISSSKLPSPADLDNIRRLSHRNFTLIFRSETYRQIGKTELLPAEEIFSLDQLEKFLSRHPISFLKAPWSSSGRGIVVSDHISRKGLMEWASGILRRQGSILCEPRWNRSLDFATEWIIIDSVPKFSGYSVFKTSDRGKYHGNVSAPQTELEDLIGSYVTEPLQKTIEAQRVALKKLVAPFYSGPLGIDMLADASGNINPCIEINLRMTMGHIQLCSGVPERTFYLPTL